MSTPIRDLLQKAGLKYSRQREAILRELQESERPLTAQDLSDRLNKRAETEQTTMRYWPSTIYRTLDYLLQADLVTRVDIPNCEQGAFLFHEQNADRHFAICLHCRKVIPLATCPLHPIVRELAADGFRVTRHRVEIYGTCAECRKTRMRKLRSGPIKP